MKIKNIIERYNQSKKTLKDAICLGTQGSKELGRDASLTEQKCSPLYWVHDNFFINERMSDNNHNFFEVFFIFNTRKKTILF